MALLNLSTRQIIALFSSAAFLAIICNAFLLFGSDAPKKVLHFPSIIPGQGQPAVDPDVSTPRSLFPDLELLSH